MATLSAVRPRSRVLALLFGLTLLLSFSAVPAALSQEDGDAWPNDPCPEGQEPVAKYETTGGSITFEKGDDVVTFSDVTTDEDGEVTGFTWSSGDTLMDSIVLKGGQEEDVVTTGGATNGTVDFGTQPALSNVVFCAATADEQEPGAISTAVTKTNDANQDASFTGDETANELDQDVQFHVEVVNDGEVAVSIASLTDTFPRGEGSVTIDLLQGEDTQDGTTISASTCDDLDETTLESGDSADCTFTLAGYAPETAPSSRTNTVDVTVDEVDGDRQDTAQDDSTVRTEDEEQSLAVDLVKTNDADGDETFSDEETAGELDQDVTFQVEIENTGDVAVTVTELTDTFDRDGEPVTIDLLDSDAAQNDGTTFVDNTCEAADDAAIASGDTFTCTYTLDGYAPATAPDSRTNTVDVTVDEVEGDRDDSAEDDSTVRTEEVAGGGTTPSELSVVVDKTNDADGDTTFSDSETADGLGQDVEFQVEVTNDGDETVTVSELADTFERDGEDVVLDLLSDEATQDGTTLTSNTCAELDAAELELAAGDTVTCAFALAGYSPDTVDEDRVNTVDVVVTDGEDDTAEDSDESTVTAPGEDVLDQPSITNPEVTNPEITNPRVSNPGVGGGNEQDELDDRDEITDEQQVASEEETRVLGNVIERDVTVQAQADDRELARTGLSAAHLAMVALMLLGVGYAATRMRPEADDG